MLPLDPCIRTCHVGKFLRKCTPFRTCCPCSSSRAVTGAATSVPLPAKGLLDQSLAHCLSVCIGYLPSSPAPSWQNEKAYFY